jgi:hypothetical protein
MKCNQAEKLIIELSQTWLDPAIKAELDAHVLDCPKCTSFREKFQMIQQGIDKIKHPDPSLALLDRTIAFCHDELIGQDEIHVVEKYHSEAIRIPKFVWIAFGALLIFTIAWAVPVIKEAVKYQVFTRQAIIVIIMIIQNLMMLIFSPVLLRRLGLKSNDINFQF